MPSVTLNEVAPPVSIEQIFNMDCFKFGNMQVLFKNIYDYLAVIGATMTDLEKKVNAIPDFSKLEKQVKDNTEMLASIDKRFRVHIEDQKEMDQKQNSRLDELEKRLTDLESKFDDKFAEMMALIKQL